MEEIDEQNITCHEISKAVKKITYGKVPRIDGLSSEIFKCVGEEGISWMERIFNEAWNSGTIPRNRAKQSHVQIIIKETKQTAEITMEYHYCHT